MRIDWDAVIEDTALAVLPASLAGRLMLWREDRRGDAAATAARVRTACARSQSWTQTRGRGGGGTAEVIRDGTTGLPIS